MLNENFTLRTSIVKTLERTGFSARLNFAKARAKSKKDPPRVRTSVCLPKIENKRETF
jgi:hypothetical protein